MPSFTSLFLASDIQQALNKCLLIGSFTPKAQRGRVTCSESHHYQVVKSECELMSERPESTLPPASHLNRSGKHPVFPSLLGMGLRVSPADLLPWKTPSMSSESRWFLVFPVPCSASDPVRPLEKSALWKQVHLNYEKQFAELAPGAWGNWCLNLRASVCQCLNTAIINKVY